MRALKLIASAAVLFIALPVVIVGVLGLLFSPLQTTARATEPSTVMEAHDIMLSDVVKSEVFREEQASLLECSAEAGETDGDRADVCESGEETPGAGVDPEGYELASADANSDEGDLPADQMTRDDSTYAEYVEGGVYAEDASDLHGVADVAFGTQEAAASEEPSETADRQNASENHYTSDELRAQGVIADGGYQYTWYSQRVLPGDGLAIEGRHVSDEGYVVDAQERIVVASSDLPYGAEVAVPFGSGTAVVLDTGCASGVLDVYTNF